MPRGLEANTWTCDASGSGRLDHTEVGRIRATPNRVRLGRTPRPRLIIDCSVAKPGNSLNSYGLIESSSTVPATSPGYRAA
jgi:hypothetical protein